MSSGIYTSIDEATLLQMRGDVIAQIRAAQQGKRFIAVGGAGKSFQKDVLPLPKLKEELEEINYALSQKNPDAYGKRTKMLRFNFGNTYSQ